MCSRKTLYSAKSLQTWRLECWGSPVTHTARRCHQRTTQTAFELGRWRLDARGQQVSSSGRTSSAWSACRVPGTWKDEIKILVLNHLDKNLWTSMLFEPPFPLHVLPSPSEFVHPRPSLVPSPRSLSPLPWLNTSLPDFKYFFLMTSNCLLQKLWKTGSLSKDCHHAVPESPLNCLCSWF